MKARTVSPWLILFIVTMGQFMVVLDATIVNVALPSIQTDLSISDSSLQWIVNAYTLVFGGFLLLGGRAADLIGRRTLFLAGIVVFSAASLLSGLAQTEETLIVARALQGLGGALLSPAALAVITTTFSEGSERTKALAVWAAVASGGSAIGLLLGGILVDALSWEWIFFVNVPVGIALTFAALRLVPNSRVESARRHFDIPGAVSVTAGLVNPGLRDRQGAGVGLGLGRDARPRRRRPGAARRLRRDRAPLPGAAGPPGDLPQALAGARQRRLPDPDGGDVLDVLLRLDLRPERPRLLAARVRARLPPGDRRDHDRRHRRPAAGAADRCSRDHADRDAGGGDRARHSRRDHGGRRHLRGPARRADADLDRDGPLVRADDAGRDHRASISPRPASPPGSSTPRSRSAARSGSRSSRPWPTTAPPRCSAGSAARATPAQQNVALVEGFQLAFYVAAGLFVVGTILIATLLRRRDVARIEEAAVEETAGPDTGEVVVVPA